MNYAKRISLLFLFLLPLTLLAQRTGTVVSVHDGDTFTVVAENGQKIKVRLHGVDTPELKQSFGKEVQRQTEAKVLNKKVKLEEKGKDRYKRTIAIVYLDNGLCVNAWLLENGLAWHYLKYDQNQRWQALEDQARKNRIGLWKNPDAQAPWDWRKANKN